VKTKSSWQPKRSAAEFGWSSLPPKAMPGCQRIPDQAQSLGQDSLRMRLVNPQGTDKIPSRLIYV
jgi:hypothetical protein